MSINENPIEIRLTPRFQKDLKILAKRYRSIRQDLQPLLRTLQTGQTPGDRIQGFNFPVFKVRLKNSDIQKGKSGGYRVIYYLQTQTAIVLITLYSKTDQTDITDRAIAEAISQLDF
ncbi:type II toxin-antitoxin system RelE family toxin [Microcystis aeruginosa]|uniref:type II toxin-antitoxin system RelE family toxin n=1 Tax=Microcystis aeruginosa TaxID=1126 RepID=UPI00232B1DDB|nr:type II toxin-antitoxin system RelE/ParE family toxin [Microcystis aeruginosa]MDB9418193.1 type II toxin-antitoxin system RelE/ParE family toxin [Microcystis aeruginosa CS-556/03]